MDHYGTNFNEAFKKAEEISNNTSGDVVNDSFGGRILEPLEDGVSDFNKAAENIYMPKKDF